MSLGRGRSSAIGSGAERVPSMAAECLDLRDVGIVKSIAARVDLCPADADEGGNLEMLWEAQDTADVAPSRLKGIGRNHCPSVRLCGSFRLFKCGYPVFALHTLQGVMRENTAGDVVDSAFRAAKRLTVERLHGNVFCGWIITNWAFHDRDSSLVGRKVHNFCIARRIY